MSKYLTNEQLKTTLTLGKPVEHWLSVEVFSDYTVIKWLRIDRETNGSYTLCYFESFDE